MHIYCGNFTTGCGNWLSVHSMYSHFPCPRFHPVQIFGTFSYFISRLNDDMVSLADNPPRPVKILRQQHRDDKPFLHRRGDIYYLSWGCFYAMGNSPYGPFNYSGSILDVNKTVNTTFSRGGGTRDRHGSFFSLHGQDYFACNDQSHGGGGAFRSTIISYVHYRRNGRWCVCHNEETWPCTLYTHIFHVL